MRVSIKFNSAENCRSTTAPSRFGSHSLIDGRYFYTLPTRLWKLIVGEVGGERFDEELLELEFAMSELVGDHGYFAGLRDGRAFQYEYLGDRQPIQLPEEYARLVGLTREAAQQIELNASQRLETVGIPGRGYLG